MSAPLSAGALGDQSGSAQRRPCKGLLARYASQNRGFYNDGSLADRPLRRARHHLRRVGGSFRARGGSGQRADAGDRGGGTRRRAGLSQAPIHHDRHRRRGHLFHPCVLPRLAGGVRIPDRRGALGRRRLHRHERLGARQCPHRPGRDPLACRRPRARVQGGRHYRSFGRRPGASRGHPLFRVSHRSAAFGPR